MKSRDHIEDFPEDDPPSLRHVSQNRDSAESKRRRNPGHCPVCLTALKKNRRRTRLMKHCYECNAHPSSEKSCRRCAGISIRANKTLAACRQCGLHGRKSNVIAD